MREVGLKKLAYKFSPAVAHPVIRRVERSDIASRLAGGAFWSLVGRVVSRGFLLVSLILAARILGQEEYGRVGIVRSTIGTFMIFASFSMSITTTKFIAQYRNTSKSHISGIVFWSLLVVVVAGSLVTLALIGLSPFIASQFINDLSISPMLKLAACILFLVALEGVLQGVLAGYESFGKIALANTVSGITGLVGIILLAQLLGGLGVILGLLLRMAVQVMALGALVFRELRVQGIRPAPIHKRESFKMLFSFGLPAFLGGIVPSIAFWASAVLLTREAGYEQMAIFDAANQFRAGILTLHSAAGMILLPVFSNMFEKEKSRYERVIGKVLTINIVLAGMIFAGIAALSPFLMGLFGEKYALSWHVLVFIALTAALGIGCDILKKVLASQGRMWVNFFTGLIMALILMGTARLCVRYGAFGLSISYTTASTVLLCMLLYYTRTSVKYKTGN
ncbi:O-antigen translocase [Anaerohalosphaera lusitana]|uniref:O-antigen translocase n=1 Tax=Anaerohalosphaera lusitana TaxID=1936003 RepID=A0A1U9NLF6_9BACT|nr:oligosaccharide flippase family protein [Anaerohalosphaera lusitana]AQT68326.1 O-antigen translocase [Anaerohalosphaera lusitana]